MLAQQKCHGLKAKKTSFSSKLAADIVWWIRLLHNDVDCFIPYMPPNNFIGVKFKNLTNEIVSKSTKPGK